MNLGRQLVLSGCLGLVLMGVGGEASAEDRIYVGASLGYAGHPEWAEIARAALARAGLTASTIDDFVPGWKVFAGYAFNSAFAVELAYNDYGKFYANSVCGFGCQVTLEQEITGTAVSLIGMVPLAEVGQFFVKAGAMRWKARTRVSDPSVTLTGTDDGTDAAFGVGLDLKATQNVALRFQFEYFRLDDTKVYLTSAGLLYRF
jgi:OOP family OmpA-OmpF porin